MSLKTFGGWMIGMMFGSMGFPLFICAAIETKTGREALAIALSVACLALASFSATKIQRAYERASKPCDRPHKLW